MVGSSASTLVAATQSLVLLPLYLKTCGIGLYGAWLATGEALVWLLAFDFGIPNLLIQRVGAAKAKGEPFGAQFGSSLVSLVAIALVVVFVAVLASPFVPGLFSLSEAEAESLSLALRIGAVSTGLMLVAYGFIGLARGMQETGLVQGVSLAGTVLGFALTAWLLASGIGLVSIAYGLLVRSSLTLFGGVAFSLTRKRSIGTVRPTRAAFNDIRSNCPPMFAAGIGYALMNNSMVTIAALMFGPAAATMLGVTRKAADIAKMALDMVGHASYGGFAHLWAGGDAVRARAVYRELQSTFFLVACPLLAAYVAVNGALVEVWVGRELFGGTLLTVALALATIAGSWSYFQIGLYRSMGHHSVASNTLLVECAARLFLMVGLGYALGPVGLAIGAIVTALASGIWVNSQLVRETGSPVWPASAWLWRSIPLALAVVVGSLGLRGDWKLVLAFGSLAFVVAFLSIVATDPALVAFRRKLVGGRA
jgi:O-antigen/teichoic acid export membrane protein